MLKSLPRARRRAAIAFVAACLVAQTFLSSAERALAASDAGDCTPIAKIAKSLKDGVTVTALTPGQFNFLRGFYMGLPPTLQGKPPGTGAVLVQQKGSKAAMLLWTRGTLYCHATAVPPEFIDALKATKTGSLDGEGDEL